MFYKLNYAHDTKAAAHQPVARKPVVKDAPRYKPQSSQNCPLDPDDLTRRLYVVLAEQKTHAEKKRRARAAVEAERQAKQVATAAKDVDKNQPRGPRAIPLRTMREISPNVPPLKVHIKDVQQHEPVEQHPTGSKSSTGSSDRGSEDASLSPSSYHHIPQVAASQFARTTTVETVTEKHLVHKLSMQALKFHLGGPNAMTGTTTDTAPCEQTKALRRAQSMRERQYERNQFQHTQTLAATAEVDERSSSHFPHKTSFQDYLKSKVLDHQGLKHVRRKSTGGMLGKLAPAAHESVDMPSMVPLENQLACDHHEVVVNAEEHRVDWTQSDEAESPQKPAGHHLLRKAESKWALRTRLGSFSKHGRGDKLSSPIEDKEDELLKSTTKGGGFFARFRR